jgi:hypothetical protein
VLGVVVMGLDNLESRWERSVISRSVEIYDLFLVS